MGVGNGHGVFLLVKVTASNVDAHVAAAATPRGAHYGRVSAAIVVDLVIVAVLRDLSGSRGSAEYEAVIQAGFGRCVRNGGGVVLLVASACCHVDANVAAGARGGAAHFGVVAGSFVKDAVAGTALFIVRICSRADIDHCRVRRVVAMAIAMTVTVPVAMAVTVAIAVVTVAIAIAMAVVVFVVGLPSVYSNSHDRSNCENQRLDCHRRFHGDSPYLF
ncbi:hypothetical protein D3C84_627680 [compost metagenome]